MIDQQAGCKIGWEWYDDEHEARAAAARAREHGESKALRGYDFGYAIPGEIQHYTDHPAYGDCWRVTTP